jgi:hypothetical protein
MIDPDFDLTESLDAEKLTGSAEPFVLFERAKKEFMQARESIMALAKGRTLFATNVHMSQLQFERDTTGIAGVAAAITAGIQGCLRVFVPPDERQGITLANPDWAEMPFIKAAESNVWGIYADAKSERPHRDATPGERKKAAQLILLAVRYLESIVPGASAFNVKLLQQLADFGYRFGDNMPVSLQGQVIEKAPPPPAAAPVKERVPFEMSGFLRQHKQVYERRQAMRQAGLDPDRPGQRRHWESLVSPNYR